MTVDEAAPTCAHTACGRELPADSPSKWFCCGTCQQVWTAQMVDAVPLGASPPQPVRLSDMYPDVEPVPAPKPPRMRARPGLLRRLLRRHKPSETDKAALGDRTHVVRPLPAKRRPSCRTARASIDGLEIIDPQDVQLSAGIWSRNPAQVVGWRMSCGCRVSGKEYQLICWPDGVAEFVAAGEDADPGTEDGDRGGAAPA